MEISGTHTYAAPIDAVVAMLADPEAVRAKYEGMGHRDVEIHEIGRDGDRIHVSSTRVVDVDLPGFARKVLQPTNTMHQTDEWTADGDGWAGRFDVQVDGAPVRLSGTMRLTPGDGDCTQEVTIAMDVKVPLVGGKIADWVGKNDARQTLDAEFAAGDRWLAEHPAG